MKKQIKFVYQLNILSFLLSIFLIYACSCGILTTEEEKVLVETSCGDSFYVSYDSFKDKSLLEDNNSRFNAVIKGKITNKDIELLYNSKEIKVYKIAYLAVFDIGNGFETFHGDLNYSNDVTSIIINNILSDYEFFSYNINYFLDSVKYDSEAQCIIISLAQGDYKQLSKYGLTELMINNNDEMELLKQKATEIQRMRNISN